MKWFKLFLLIVMCVMIIPIYCFALEIKITKTLNWSVEFEDNEDEEDNKDELFIINVKETMDGNFVGVIYSLDGGEYIVKFTSEGETLWSKRFEDSSDESKGYDSNNNYIDLSDVIEVESDIYLITTGNYEKNILYDRNTDTTTTLDTSSDVGHPSGRSIYNFGNNFITIGGKAQENDDTKHTIVLQTFNSKGEQKNLKEIELDGSGQDYNNKRSYYYGSTVVDNKMYILAIDADSLVIIEVDENLDYTKRVLDTTFLGTYKEDIYEQADTQMALDEEGNIYFAISTGLYKITKDNIIRRKASDIDYTSVVAVDKYLITGGINDGKAIIVIYDSGFNIIDKIIIADYFDVTEEDGFSIVKSLAISNNSLVVGGMVDGDPIIVEFEVEVTPDEEIIPENEKPLSPYADETIENPQTGIKNLIIEGIGGSIFIGISAYIISKKRKALKD